MSTEISTIQSLKAVDAWIDVINANINGGVRTAFKSSRLRFAGSNVELVRAGGAASLPLQLPEPGLITANTVIDFTQGAVTSSTENTHLAIQGPGFFKMTLPGADPTVAGFDEYYYSRDGEFRWMPLPAGKDLFNGSYMWTPDPTETTYVLVNPQGLTVWNNADSGGTIYHGVLHATVATNGSLSGGSGTIYGTPPAQFMDSLFAGQVTVHDFDQKQALRYSRFGATVFENPANAAGAEREVPASDRTVLSKALEASNSSMTQSVPELSLAQKLFSALTKVLQISQTNTDSVLNTVR